MPPTDLTDIAVSELHRRLGSMMAEYESQLVIAGNCFVKIENIKREMRPIIEELSAREGVTNEPA